MPDPTPPPAPTPTPPPVPTPEPPKTFTQEQVNAFMAEDRRKFSDYDALKAKVAAQDKVTKASMTEAERQVAEAKTAGHAEAVTEFGKRLARTEFDAVAGRRNKDFDTASALEWVDLARFVGEDGEPDSKAIKAAVERLVPEAAGGPPSFDGGARTKAAPAKDMNDLLRRATGRA